MKIVKTNVAVMQLGGHDVIVYVLQDRTINNLRHRLIYAQNRLVSQIDDDVNKKRDVEVLLDFLVIPEIDELLQHYEDAKNECELNGYESQYC